MEEFEREEYQMEISNRIKNLVWTVCEDYSLEVKPDVENFLKCRPAAIYDGVRQGAFVRFFDKEQMSLYLVKKLYLQAAEAPLMTLAWLAIEEAVHSKMAAERPGIERLRKEAMEALLERQFFQMTETAPGRLKAAVLREALEGERRVEKKLRGWLDLLYTARNAKDTMELIQIVDRLYNEVFDTKFEKLVGGLERVLAVTIEELTAENWRDFLTEELYEQGFEQYLEQMAQRMTASDYQEDAKNRQEANPKRKITLVSEEQLAKAYTYVERNFGKTYLTPLEEKRLNRLLCRGVHGDCSLYFTDGILENPAIRNYQYEYARKQRDKNKYVYYEKHRIVKQNIALLTDLLKKALVLQGEGEFSYADSGKLVPARLWKTEHTDDTKVFRKDSRGSRERLVVELLIDASGSQRVRQELVALQAYILAEALSNVGIPHRILSFCTFWDYTVLQRFREYEEPRSANQRLFAFTTSSNNRDGLAIRAAAQGLLEREEEKKLMIVLSDGRPYDALVNRPNAKNPKPYTGSEAVRDTAFSVRSLRNEGVCVLGVFVGEEQDLETERRIFGKDFAYIRDISYFSKVTGKFLKKLLAENE